MIIPSPSFKKVRYDLSTMKVVDRFKFIIKNPPRIELTSDWILTLNDGTKIIVPKGFVNDGASVPRALWLIPGFSPFGVLLEGGILHDFAYQHGYLLSPDDGDFKDTLLSDDLYNSYHQCFEKFKPIFAFFPQAYFDDLMHKIVTETTGSKLIASAAHFMLAKFGKTAWDNYRSQGPAAYGRNSLDLPGVNCSGYVK